MFSSLSYFWGETFRSLLRNRFMALASILTVTLSMFILGVFLAAVHHRIICSEALFPFHEVLQDRELY